MYLGNVFLSSVPQSIMILRIIMPEIALAWALWFWEYLQLCCVNCTCGERTLKSRETSLPTTRDRLGL